MGHHKKAIAYVTIISLISPLTLLYTHSRLSPSWNVLILLVGLYLLTSFTYPFFTDPLRNLPHPPTTYFILGNGPSILRRPPGAQYEAWARNIPNDGLLSWHGFFHLRPFLLVTSVEGLREVLLDKPYDFVKPDRVRNFLARILGQGIIVSEGQMHKLHRKAVAPAFSGHHIQELFPLFHKKAQQFVDVLGALLKPSASASTNGKRTGVVEIGAVATRVTLDIIGMAGLGRDFRTLENSDDELAKCYEELTDPRGVPYFIVNMVLPSWLVRSLPWSENIRFNNATTAIRRTAFNLLNEKRETLKTEPEGHKDILTILLRSKTQLTDEELVDQLLTFLAAGHETTSSALTWAMYLLALHQDVQEQLREEVRKTVAAEYADDEERVKAIDAMPFLQAVCLETLRLFPTVPGTARRVVRPTTLLGYQLRIGTDVIIYPWVINRHPDLWGPQADDFLPSRWLGDNATNGGAHSPLAFITFLHGPRSCIGQGFARSELKYLLAASLVRYRWEMADPKEEVVRAGGITIKPEAGLRVRLTEI